MQIQVRQSVTEIGIVCHLYIKFYKFYQHGRVDFGSEWVNPFTAGTHFVKHTGIDPLPADKAVYWWMVNSKISLEMPQVDYGLFQILKKFLNTQIF